MRETVYATKTIAAPSGAVWAAVAGIGGFDRWLPLIESCRVEGTGEGALRYLRLADGGGEIVDRIDSIDHRTKRLRYTRLSSPFPANNYTAVVEVRAAPDDRSEVSWTVEFDVAPEARDDLVALLSGVLSSLIDGIETDVG